MSVRWYDAEGCIESAPIDIIRHLPLLIVFMDVIQRSKRLRGYGDAKTILDDIGTIHTDTATRPNFELSGRRMYGASFTLKPSTPPPIASNLNASPETAAPGAVTIDPNGTSGDSAAPVNNHTPMQTRATTRRKTDPDPDPLKAEDAQHFFKVSWPERSRKKEPDILQVALDRVRDYLPVEHQEAVTGHLPNIVHFREVEGTSTAIIRQLLGLPTTGSRVQFWMVSKRLSGLATLVEPKAFLRAFWEIIRCMLNFAGCSLHLTNSIMARSLSTMADWYCSRRHQLE